MYSRLLHAPASEIEEKLHQWIQFHLTVPEAMFQELLPHPFLLNLFPSDFKTAKGITVTKKEKK